MTALSAQVYTPTGSMAPEDRSRFRSSSNLRSRAQEASTGSRWRFTRSTTNLREAAAQPASPIPAPRTTTPAPKAERTPSKMSLFSLFSRPKVETARGHIEVGLAVPMRPQTPAESRQPTSTPKSSLRQNPSPPAQQTIRQRSSQMFRPMSMRPATPHREFGDWDAPPLFQAFPQSLKHATVQACVFPAEILMRTQSQRRQAEMMRDRMDSVRDLSTISENGSDAKRLEKNHRRLMSNSVLNPALPELVNKIYILVTAGYVLQYAGDGTFDRLPEKILKLGKDSAAFACDLIPGKHWVLQISSHAHDDGSFEPGPKNSLLSRLRTQNATLKKAATSFLLVLESAEEMDAWMCTVRKEIDNLGGMKSKDDSIRESSSTDRSSGKQSTDTTSHRFQVQRDPNAITKVASVDSSQQAQQSGSPRIVASDWEPAPSERSVSVAGSHSGQSTRWGNNRQSVEMSSVASTPVSQHQVQLDQLRGRSRFSFMSTATSTSGPGTCNTSRDSSPAPQSPLKEFFAQGESDGLRSAMSLKSFHMNPNNSSASRRRSMQPLPVTDENIPHAITTPAKKQRHSLYSPTSPTVPELGQPSAAGPTVPSKDSEPVPVIRSPIAHIADAGRSLPMRQSVDLSAQTPVAPLPHREDSPLRYDERSYSIPPRRDVISPPPGCPAPLPPPPAQRQSVIGNYSCPTPQSLSDSRAQRRISATPKAFMRPLPIRPQAQHGDGSMIVPRRQSSLAPMSAPAPLPLGININRSVTAPIRPPSAAANMSPTSHPTNTLHSAQSQPLRRPSSVQIRSDHTPFLSSYRPIRAISSTPSFVPGRRASSIQAATPPPRVLQPTPSVDTLRQHAHSHALQPPKTVTPRRSMPAIGLPPPAPPPNMPLPTLPPNMSLPPTPPPSTPLPPTPPTMGLPAPPPQMPLPPTPPMAPTKSFAV